MGVGLSALSAQAAQPWHGDSSNEPSVPYPIHLQELLHTSPSCCCHHNTDMNLNKNSSSGGRGGEGGRRKTPIYNSTLSSSWQDLMNHIHEGSDCGYVGIWLLTPPQGPLHLKPKLLDCSMTASLCTPVSSMRKRKGKKEIVNGHFVSKYQFVRKRTTCQRTVTYC